MPTKSFIIHGHFYQPPREDPLTGIIPDEPGAEPFRNWNERILHECYQPNVELGNFQRMSFNVGPTLFNWLEAHDTFTYQGILAQDQHNYRKFGVGNAIAQPYNHTILPLATSADKNIQISWGIADFKHRFGRQPDGMWLPEAAVDDETLAIMSQKGIKYTILAPWQSVERDLNPGQPYRVQLPGGGSMNVFFFDGNLSARISFAPEATENADHFAVNELLPFLLEGHYGSEDSVLLLASDGELYGHHQPYREMFLAHLLDGASAGVGLSSTFPALWLQAHPPKDMVQIRAGTSWSCHHGISRWTGECACSSLDGRWKSHLRLSLNQLASDLDDIYFEITRPLIENPTRLRENYIHVILGKIGPQELINESSRFPLSSDQIKRITLLLESQRERQRMFTSCGWFFEDFDRIEPRNVIAYAAQAVRLIKLAVNEDLSAQTAKTLNHVTSPSSGLNAGQVFQHHLERTRQGLE